VSTSGHRRDPHLGGLVAAVVDGALDHEARERALSHLARCDDCRAEVEAQRRVKSRLARTAAPELPGGLAERLLRLPDGYSESSAAATRPTLDSELPPVRVNASFRPPTPGSSRRGQRLDRARQRGAVAGPPRERPVSRRTGRARSARRRRVAGAAVGGVAAFALSLAAVVALGSPDPTQVVVPAVDSYTVEHNRSAVGVPGADPVVEFVDLTTAGLR
jgi:anti-sigma factor RsiW